MLGGLTAARLFAALHVVFFHYGSSYREMWNGALVPLQKTGYIAVPFFYVGKLFGCTLVFIEVYDRFSSPTMSGKLVHPITDLFVIQWDEQRAFYPKGQLLGQLL